MSRVPLAALAVASCLAVGCSAAPARDQAAPADTLRGVVVITGADPLTLVQLRTDTGAVTLRGPAADSLRSAAGVEVEVAGHEDGRALRVHGFRVVGVDGRPAADGVLEILDGRAVLIGQNGARTAYGAAPAALRALAGRRVWLVGEPGRPPEAWGALIASTPR